MGSRPDQILGVIPDLRLSLGFYTWLSHGDSFSQKRTTQEMLRKKMLTT